MRKFSIGRTNWKYAGVVTRGRNEFIRFQVRAGGFVGHVRQCHAGVATGPLM